MDQPNNTEKKSLERISSLTESKNLERFFQSSDYC